MKVMQVLSGLIIVTALLVMGYTVVSHWWVMRFHRTIAYGKISEPERLTEELAAGEVCQRWQTN